ncbi:MAG: GNAT family N-acetyltransferase [Oscillospiraceae bacterium]|nr:GNAT family N-acetyltransferase [Oscillospiraceae bacterium]
MTEIYLIRHTQAEGNRYRMMQGYWDGEITALGRRQIEALAQRFAQVKLDAVYASDLSRAVLTAEGAARGSRLPVQTRTDLREINVGPWEQQFFGNVFHAQPELAQTFLYDAENWVLPGAETFPHVRERALRQLTELAEENEGRSIAVVSHGVTLRCIMSGITGIPLSETEKLPIFGNTAVSRLLWDGERFRIDYTNDLSHLPQELRTDWNTSGDLRDEVFDPEQDRAFYEHCYADSWQLAHGDLRAFSPEVYFRAAVKHHRQLPGSVMKLFHGEEPVGLLDLDPERGKRDGVGWISLLYLLPAYRRRGCGIQLLARALFFYPQQGRDRLQLQVAESNTVARRFYEREGFVCIGEQKSAGGTLLLMERSLKKERHG